MNEQTGRRRRPSKGDQREEAILASARTLLCERPMSKITVAQIAEGAGITAPTFYFYFATKTDVLAALLDRVAERVRGELSGWLENEDGTAAGAEEALRQALTTNACLWAEQGALLREVFVCPDTDPRLSDFRDRMGEHLVTAVGRRIERDREAGRALPGPPEASDLARTLVEMTFAAFSAASRRDDPALRDGRLVETLAVVVMRSVYGSAPSSGA
ncbi:TetR/AcrR family transcriptional regulator [Nocardiopsis gilva YIM 90087]|uniref:TetR/AcrR family transcriptional regulator n=1 Tax=Nocardiopsis gilva YIM 90087 TaxID=1235441 RepID=A0A223SAI9_9ACTN|nr:TetR/AcrR family transcriptional regulator [Nocardiopsis gilva]ASU85113.1 TetR/AcrR family transcriptional regulator [Nocardiopsis gilva YIM 90087]